MFYPEFLILLKKIGIPLCCGATVPHTRLGCSRTILHCFIKSSLFGLLPNCLKDDVCNKLCIIKKDYGISRI